MKKIPAGKFKSQCLSILKEVAEKHEIIIVTKHGKPLVKVIPYSNSETVKKNPLKDSILFEKDIVAPIEVEWEATK